MEADFWMVGMSWQLVKDCTVLEEATVMMKSRPHACEKLDAGRRVKVV